MIIEQQKEIKQEVQANGQWKNFRIGDLIVKTKQLDPKKGKRKFQYIDVSSVNRDTSTVTNTSPYHSDGAPSRAKKIVYENDIIIATVRPTLKRVALIDKDLHNQICSTAFCVLRSDKSKLLPKYLYYHVQTPEFINKLYAIQRGANYPAVTDKDIKSQLIPLPPLPEQKEIAAVLTTVQEAREKTDAVIEAACQLKKSIMKHLFAYGPIAVKDAEKVKLKETEIGLVPKEWNYRKLGEIAKIKSGGTPSRKIKEYWNGNIPWIKTGNIDFNKIENADEYITEEGLYNSSARIVPVGTLLMAMYGQGVTRGKVGITKIEAAINQACAAIFPNKEIENAYLFYFFQYHYEYIREFGHGANQKNLSGTLLKTFPIVFPKLDIQRQMIELIDSIDQKIASETKKKEALDKLFKSLLDQLMTGQLRVVDLDI